MKAKELNKRISEVVYTVMKSKGVVEYNDYSLHEEIRELIMPFINQFEKEVTLGTLRKVQMGFEIQSDLSTKTHGYRRLCEEIEQLPKKFGIYPDPANKRIKTLNALLKFVVGEYHISLEDIKGKDKSREYAEPRQVYCYFAKKLWPKSFLKVIGAVINKGHATALYSIRIVKRDMKIYKDFRQEVEKMWDKINPKLEQPSNKS